ARLMPSPPAGSMLSVRLPSAEVQKRLEAAGDRTLALASDNGPSLCVVAGPTEAVAKLEAALLAEGAVCRALVTSHAFHSPMMDPAVGPFTDLVRKVKLSHPRIPFVSTRTGTWIKDAEATDPAYWGGHLRDTVRFAQAAKTLLTDVDAVLLEVGPRATLVTLARQQKAKLAAYPTMGERVEAEGEAVKLALGGLFVGGANVPWEREHEGQTRHRIRLPAYPFERKRYWVEAPVVAPPTMAMAMGATTTTTTMASPPVETATAKANPMRKEKLIGQLKDALEEASGIDGAGLDPTATFLELGLDSLFLTQFALAVQKKFGVKVTFRELVERLPNLDALAAHLDAALPPEAAAAPAAPPPAPAPAPVTAPVPQNGTSAPAVSFPVMTMPHSQPDGSIRSLIETQLQLMQQQLALLSGGTMVAAPVVAPTPSTISPTLPTSLRDVELGASRTAGDEPAVAQKYDVKKAFGAIARITTTGDRDMTPQQRARYDAFVRRYTAKTKASKAQQQENRKVLADPRVVTGFRPAIKELVYQIVIDRSHGSKVWDLDGNEYVDVLCGFGCNLFGWQPSFVTDAVKAQLERGHEIGPQHPLAAECARLICEFTHFDRAAFCNTGSEAVMGCMRVARTVTGRSKIVFFTGSYHGIFDEVIVRGTKKHRSIPAAPGIMPESSQNVVVLDYGTDETLAWIREHASELAAVLVEPIQSRRPDFQPREFLHEVRAITEKSGTVLIFDEVITGFRMGPGGAQEFFGVKADIGSYGKVVGGGLPVGVIAGKRELMDALDGGYWQFGDDSVPTVGVTYFAGTFVRHPLALAAMHAVLLHLKQEGPALQQMVNAKADRLARELNAFFGEVGAPLKIKHFASLWKTFYLEDHPFQDLLFHMMRDRGVHVMDGFPCFFTTAHSDEDVTKVIEAYKASVLEMQDSGFLPPRKQAVFDAASPPVPGARLGRDPSGNPAWFLPNPEAPGKFMKVERTNGHGSA
ncbi:MAG TPA: aminotransferase class III-fold pyridoxal phosphate-dependent enzyme, partial [Polyangiaceae bacterium]